MLTMTSVSDCLIPSIRSYLLAPLPRDRAIGLVCNGSVDIAKIVDRGEKSGNTVSSNTRSETLPPPTCLFPHRPSPKQKEGLEGLGEKKMI